MSCIHNIDDYCTNADCPYRADDCPVTLDDSICKYRTDHETAASHIVCPLCDKERCVGRYECREIKEYIEKRKENNMKKAMISQPMRGLTEEQITAGRERAIEALNGMGYEVINTRFTDEWYSKENMEERGVVNIPICFLAKSIENMSLCHAVLFVKGWEKARGCKIEYEVAKKYGMTIIEE